MRSNVQTEKKKLYCKLKKNLRICYAMGKAFTGNLVNEIKSQPNVMYPSYNDEYNFCREL